MMMTISWCIVRTWQSLMHNSWLWFSWQCGSIKFLNVLRWHPWEHTTWNRYWCCCLHRSVTIRGQWGDSELIFVIRFPFFIFWRWSCWITEGFRDGMVLHQYGNLQVKIGINYWSQSLLHVSQAIDTNSLGIFKLIENCDLI